MPRRKTETSPSKKPAPGQPQPKKPPVRNRTSKQADSRERPQGAGQKPLEKTWWDGIDLDLCLPEEAPEPDPRDFYMELEDPDWDYLGRAA